MVNFESIPNARWSEFKREIHETWERLTDAEVEDTGGDVRALGQLIARRYGIPGEDVRTRLESVLAEFRRDDHLEGPLESLEDERTFQDKFRQF